MVVPRLNRGRQRDAGVVLTASSNARRPLGARLPFQLIALKGHAAIYCPLTFIQLLFSTAFVPQRRSDLACGGEGAVLEPDGPEWKHPA